MTGPSHGHAKPSRRWGALLVIGMIVVILHGHASAASPDRTVGVVEFYALSPLTPFEGVLPEEYAAADASRVLPRIAGDQFEVIPRGTMRQAEAALGWRPWDVLNFTRLGQLAGRVGADDLVVGWIRLLHLDTEGPGIGRLGFGRPLSGSTNVLLQIFDARGGRIVAEAPGDGYAIGQVRAFVAEEVLHQATAQALPRVFAKLTPAP
jgi:hypothetical protein